MDLLPVQVTQDPDPEHQVEVPGQPGNKRPDFLIAVRYQNFIQGKDTPILKT
jgi:hypothetical protein